MSVHKDKRNMDKEWEKRETWFADPRENGPQGQDLVNTEAQLQQKSE